MQKLTKSDTSQARIHRANSLVPSIASKARNAGHAAMPYAALFVITVAAHAQTGSLDTITAVGSTFATWLRAFAGILGVVAIVWGGINMYFSDLGRGMAKVVAGIVGLIIAGYAQSIVNTFFTTSS